MTKRTISTGSIIAVVIIAIVIGIGINIAKADDTNVGVNPVLPSRLLQNSLNVNAGLPQLVNGKNQLVQDSVPLPELSRSLPLGLTVGGLGKENLLQKSSLEVLAA